MEHTHLLLIYSIQECEAHQIPLMIIVGEFHAARSLQLAGATIREPEHDQNHKKENKRTITLNLLIKKTDLYK
jgi:hypothetical protein